MDAAVARRAAESGRLTGGAAAGGKGKTKSGGGGWFGGGAKEGVGGEGAAVNDVYSLLKSPKSAAGFGVWGLGRVFGFTFVFGVNSGRL